MLFFFGKLLKLGNYVQLYRSQLFYYFKSYYLIMQTHHHLLVIFLGYYKHALLFYKIYCYKFKNFDRNLYVVCLKFNNMYYRFVGSLIASDLLSSAVLGPSLLVSSVKTIHKALIIFVATSTIFSILVIAMDRYTAVLSPLHYATNVTRQKSVLGMY